MKTNQFVISIRYISMLSAAAILTGCTGAFHSVQLASTSSSSQLNGAATDTSVLLNPSGGNVGISTNSPAAGYSPAATTLQIGDGTNLHAAFKMVENEGAIEIAADSNRWYFKDGNSTYASFTPMLTLDNSNSRVGVGTMSPERPFDVRVSSTAGLNSLRVAGYQPALEVFNQAGTANWYFGNNDADNNSLYIGRGYGPNQGIPPNIVIAQGGNVGINTTSPLYSFDVNGAAHISGDLNVASLTYSSDKRLKTDIQILESALPKIQSLKGITYVWNDLGKKRGLNDQGRQMGLLAQDVETVFPEAVKTDKQGFKSVNYPVLVSPLIQALKEFYAKWTDKTTEQDRKIATLETENAELKRRLETIEKKLNLSAGSHP